jgi:hypothetical protein
MRKNGKITNFPSIEFHLPDVMNFVSALAQGYQSGDINCWRIMEEKVHTFFSLDKLDKVNAVAPRWRDMASYADGTTLIHVMSVFTALILCPEFQQASKTQQELLKWIVFFHDIAKEIQQGPRDFTHGFRSAAMAGETLPGVGFAATSEYDNLIDDWVTLVNAAMTKQDKTSVSIQDNRKLPEIVNGIERLFGHNTPGALIVRTVLLHTSIDVIKDWPQAAPLSEIEIRGYLDFELIPLLRVMMLVDNDGWALFNHSTKERYRQETLTVFRRFENIAAAFRR